MKKIVLSIVSVAFAAVVAFNINAGLGSNAGTDVTLANVEALAIGEGNSGNCESSPGRYCPGGATICCWFHTTILHKK
ncbi:MAG: NVEALA domain-containing protein [Dysgonamonadaceae bacterium]|jgi:hypothetical protein|nr:NVEALA domain-containing protein [Dysgonamonadaceae bacterium]